MPAQSKAPRPARFSKQTLEFLMKAGRQKSPDWLDRNRADYERLLLSPLQEFAGALKRELARDAVGYHFPLKGIGRLRRPGGGEDGERMYKNWMVYSASRPSGSRFDSNPNLFFLLHPEDREDPVLIAGGLYMPSSRQLKAIRTAISEDATEFERLFASKPFERAFPGGFSKERSASRVPRGFAADHPKMDWIRLQGFFVWRPVKMREFASADFAARVASDFRQVLRLNALLDRAIEGKWTVSRTASASKAGAKANSNSNGKRGEDDVLSRLEEIEGPRREMDF